MNCKGCDAPLTGRQKMFCSIRCRNSANGKKTGGWNRIGVDCKCEECGAEFSVPPSRAKNYNVRACSKECLAAIQSRERKGVFGVGTANPMFIDGRSSKSYRRNLKDACERCGSGDPLLIHHKDENRRNNDPSNLETLCKRCHQVHHECWRNLPSAA